MRSVYLSPKASRARLREAENARNNRREIVKAYSTGQISRRDLIRWGVITAGGLLLPINGLSPFASSVYADGIPTGVPPSPLFGVQPFTQPMPRLDVLPRKPVSALSPPPTAAANTTQQPLNAAIEGVKPGDTGPVEGRPPGPIWAHQGFAQFPPQFAFEFTEEGAKDNTVYNPSVASTFNSGINASAPFPLKFHPSLPTQSPLNLWTFNGTYPPKLAQIRYGESAITRIQIRLPCKITDNPG